MAKLQFTVGGVSYPAKATKKALEFIGKRWRKNARTSLKMQGRMNTGALYNSMKVFVGANQHAMYVNITPDVDYWDYVDKGVQGASKNIFTKQSPQLLLSIRVLKFYNETKSKTIKNCL